MRRSIVVSMSAALLALSTPLAGQAAWTVGLASTLGSEWQIEGIDIGYVHGVRAGPVRHVLVLGRLGSFVEENTFFTFSRGFVAALAVEARTGALPLFEVGSEDEPSTIGLDLTLEVAGYLAAHSPLPQGSAWGSVALLPGLRLGGGGNGFRLQLGPAAFLGRTSDVRALVGIRVESPLAGTESQP